MNPPTYQENNPNTTKKAPFNNNFNRAPRMQNYPYTTQWKDGKSIPNPTQNRKGKGTPDPLKRITMNMFDDMPWYIICQSPHSSEYCVVSQSFATNQHSQNGEDEEDHEDVTCNMVTILTLVSC